MAPSLQIPIWISYREAHYVLVMISLPVRGVETTKGTPCSSRDLILALEAAGGLSPVILAHTDAEERFNGHWSAYLLVRA